MSKHAQVSITKVGIACILVVGAMLALMLLGCGGSDEKPAPPPEEKAEPEAKPEAKPEPRPVPKPEPEVKPEATAEGEAAPAAEGEAKAGKPSEEDKGPEKVEFDSKKGKVTFPHHVHQEIGACKDCHHKAEAGKKPVACRSCHGKKDDSPKMMAAAHKVCRDCHKDQGGPTKCDECHAKQ